MPKKNAKRFPSITLKLVRDAYKKTQYAPRQGVWIHDGEACPLAALRLAAEQSLSYHLRDQLMGRPGIEVSKWVCSHFGVSQNFVYGFIQGVDEPSKSIMDTGYTDFRNDAAKAAYKRGHRLGARIGAELFKGPS